jgi:hypothetical protein
MNGIGDCHDVPDNLVKPVIDGARDMAIFKKILKSQTEDHIVEMLKAFFSSKDPWVVENGYSITAFKTKINRFVIQGAIPSKTAGRLQNWAKRRGGEGVVNS